MPRGEYKRLSGDDLSAYAASSPTLTKKKYRGNPSAKGAPLKIGSDREYVRLMPKKTVESAYRALDGIENELGSEMFSKVFKTITVDNGSELADYPGIEGSADSGKRTKVYYCHPRTSALSR